MSVCALTVAPAFGFTRINHDFNIFGVLLLVALAGCLDKPEGW